MKAFSGLNHPELFDKVVSENVNSSSKVDNDSDSDSDYEYFKVQKELETKNELKETVEQDEESTVKPSTGNKFAEAVKSALVEDEMMLPASVNQKFLIVPMKLRLVTLCSLIVEHCVLNKKGGKMIVFMATLEMVDYHSELIENALTGKDVKVKKKGQEKNKKTKKRKADDDKVSEKSFKVKIKILT